MDLAVVLDRFRCQVGWAVSGSPDAELVIRAFRAVVTCRCPPPGGSPRVDDQGVLASAEVVVSFSRKGSCRDNANGCIRHCYVSPATFESRQPAHTVNK